MRGTRNKLVMDAIMEVIEKHPQPTFDTNWVTDQINLNDPSFKFFPTSRQSVNRYFSQKPSLFVKCGKATYRLRAQFLADRFQHAPAAPIFKSRNATLPEEIIDPAQFVEGAVTTISVNRYERDLDARQKCIDHYGPICSIPACGFDFEKVYGKIGEDYIQVHHLKPLSEIGEAYKVNPIADLRPVCANCHAMIHQGGECRDIEQINEFLIANRPKK